MSGANKGELGLPFQTLHPHQQQVTILEEALRDFPHAPEILLRLANAFDEMGAQLRNIGRLRQSLEHHQKCVNLYQEYCRKTPDPKVSPAFEADMRLRFRLAVQQNNLLAEAELEYTRSHALWVRLSNEHPQDPWQQYAVASVKSHLARLLMRTGRAEPAGALLREAVAIGEKITADYPDRAEFLRRYVSSLRQIGGLLQSLQRMDEAESFLRRAMDLDLAQQAKAGTNVANRTSLAQDYYSLADLLSARRRGDEAADYFRRAIELSLALVADRPQSWGVLSELALMLLQCPDPRFRDPARVLALVSEYERANPDHGGPPKITGVAQLRLGNSAPALAALTRSLELSVGGSPEQWFYLALACQKPGDLAKAASGMKRPSSGWTNTTPLIQLC